MKKTALVPSLPDKMKIADDPILMDIINEINTPNDIDMKEIESILFALIKERLEKA